MIFKINVMNEINEIKLPEGIDRISVKQPWSDEPKKGDLAIFWDNGTSYATIRVYDRKKDNKYHYDSCDIYWKKNSIRFESKEQYEKKSF